LLGTDCFVHRLQMGNVHSKILLTKLCYLGILAPEHYVSISITLAIVKRFSRVNTAIQLHFMCTRFRAFHNVESYKSISNFYTIFRDFNSFLYIILILCLLITFHVCIIDITQV